MNLDPIDSWNWPFLIAFGVIVFARGTGIKFKFEVKEKKKKKNPDVCFVNRPI